MRGAEDAGGQDSEERSGVNPFDPFIMWWYAWQLQNSAVGFWVRSSYLVARELWLPRGAMKERTGKGLARMYRETLRDTYGVDTDPENTKGAS